MTVSIAALIILPLFSILSLLGNGLVQGQQQQFLTFQDPNGHFMIDYPSDWKIDKGNSSEVISFAIPKTNGEFSMSAQDSENLKELYQIDFDTLEGFIDPHIHNMQELQSGSSVVSEYESVKIGENPAYRIVTEQGSESPLSNKTLYVATLVGDKAYTIMYSVTTNSYQAYASIAQRMIDSFRFLNIASQPMTQAKGSEVSGVELTSAENKSLPRGIQQTEQQFLTYSDPEGRFKIQYSSDWQVRTDAIGSSDPLFIDKVSFKSKGTPSAALDIIMEKAIGSLNTDTFKIEN